MDTYTFRLRPGEDLLASLEAFMAGKGIQAGCVLTCVGSLTQSVIRLADRDLHSQFEGKFEIVSLTGTLSVNGSHLHILISDRNGRTLGGHLVPGSRVYTTSEIVLAAFPELVYRREPCEQSGYDELVVSPRV